MKEQEPIITKEQRLAEKIRQARFVWIAGNGGSASTAEHFANDLVKKGKGAVALTNSSIITMIGNDYGFDQVFSRQLEALASPKDLFIAISCSGTSPNMLQAVKTAIIKKVPYYTFEVFGEEIDYGKLEDKHLKFAHEVAGRL